MGVSRNKRNSITFKDKERIIKYVNQGLSYKDIAKRTHKSYRVICVTAFLLGINKRRFPQGDKLRYIHEHYADMETETIARELNLPYRTVVEYAYILGVKKSKELKSKAYSRGAQLRINKTKEI